MFAILLSSFMPKPVTPEICNKQLLEIMLTRKTFRRIARIAAKRGVAVNQLIQDAIREHLA